MTESDDVNGLGTEDETGVISSSDSDSESASEDQYDGIEAEADAAVKAEAF